MSNITPGRTLQELTPHQRWRQRPPFLQSPESQWPISPASPSSLHLETGSNELKASALCFSVSTESNTSFPDPAQHQTLQDLIATANQLSASDGVATMPPSIMAETLLLQQAQVNSFPEELCALKAGKSIARHSRLLSLSPEIDPHIQLMRVGG